MRTFLRGLPLLFSVLITVDGWGTVRYVDQNNSLPVSPYASWSTAATNIQDAVDAASAGDSILVTNGVYGFGGKIMSSDFSNRVAVYKALTVQSVNGPQVTIIQGAWDAATNGPNSVRCVWLTNNTLLSGFTLQQGATRPYTGFGDFQSTEGGGAWGASTSATLSNCIIRTCFAGGVGGGVYRVSLANSILTGNHGVGSGQPGVGFGSEGAGGGAANSDLRNCIITNNYADQTDGGGAFSCTLRNCYLAGNSSYMNGGAARSGTLINCTVVSNISSGYSGGGYGAAVYGAALTNTIVWNNLSRTTYPNTNYASSSLGYCCSFPLASGVGNISADPQLMADGVHISSASPCRNAGLNTIVTNTDIDGQSWSNVPSIGCDEWLASPVIGFLPAVQFGVPTGGTTLSIVSVGQSPFSYTWSRDSLELTNSSHLTQLPSGNLIIKNLSPSDAGVYSVVLSNAFGTATQQVAQIIIHAVDAGSSNPVAPYLNWETAAATIQDAVNTAAPGDIVLVTNGVYSSGGKAISGTITNRVVIDRPISVMSLNGFTQTIIEGVWDPVSINGPLAVRCAWLTNGATLNGFTLRNGATQARSGDVGAPLETGGGAWCAGTDAIVSNCLLTNNRAIYGGGIGGKLVTFSTFVGGTLNNSFVTGNYATDYGGGTCSMNVNNCTIAFNYVGRPDLAGGGAYDCNARNSIVFFNYYGFPSPRGSNNHWETSASKSFTFCCTDPPGGPGNIDFDPLFIDPIHISGSSPCRAAGSALYSTGVDIDGEPWTTSPSIGCDEIIPSSLTGPLAVSILAIQTNLFVGHLASFVASVSGHIGRLAWSFGDGATITNSGGTVQHSWNTPGDFPLTLTAFNNDYPDGVATTLMLHEGFPDPVLLFEPSIVSNHMQFRITTQGGAYYTVDYATNLAPPVNWMSIQFLSSSTGGDRLIKDTAPSSNVRYYRVRSQ